MKKALKATVKRAVWPAIRQLRHWLREIEQAEGMPAVVPFDNGYAWIQRAFAELMANDLCARKPMYAWGVIQGAALAKVLGISRISVIEFGVAGGAGLISLECAARIIENQVGIDIDVLGFDTGVGLPKPIDYRDQPNMWFEGQLPMNRGALEAQLGNSSLRIGLVQETVKQFLDHHPAPVGFVSFDLDLYSSTIDALAIFSTKAEYCLPRVTCYFDDILGHSYNDYAGERLAIAEFNQAHALRKLSPIYGLRYFVPRMFRGYSAWDCIYLAHIFDHPLYNELDSIRKAVYTDDKGRDYREPVSDDWKGRIPL